MEYISLPEDCDEMPCLVLIRGSTYIFLISHSFKCMYVQTQVFSINLHSKTKIVANVAAKIGQFRVSPWIYFKVTYLKSDNIAKTRFKEVSQ